DRMQRSWPGAWDIGGPCRHLRLTIVNRQSSVEGRPRASAFRQLLLHHLAQNVEQQLVRFLYPGGAVARDQQFERRQALREYAVASGETNALHPDARGLFDRPQHVLRPATRRERNQHVALLPQPAHLPSENLI